MSFLREVQLGESFGPYVAARQQFGFIPNLFRAQSLLPRVIEALATLESAVLLREKALSRVLKEQILLNITASRQDVYCVTAHSKILSSLGVPDRQIEQLLTDYRQAGLAAAEVALLDSCLKLSHQAPWVRPEDIEALRACGFDDDAIYEAVLVTALSSYLCTLSAGLGPEPDFEPRKLSSATQAPPEGPASASWGPHGLPTTLKAGPYVPTVYRSPKTFAPFELLQRSHGYIPNFFRAQTMWPDVLEAETDAVGRILMPEDVLSRLLWGTRIALIIGFSASIVALLVGVPLGLFAGFFGGPFDRLMSLVMDSLYAFPGLILAIAITAVLGPSILNIIVAIAVLYVPTYYRIVRGQTLSVKEEVYVEAAKSIGARTVEILQQYIFPNVIPSVAIIFSVNVADAILTGAGLSFLGLGLPPTIADWGIDVARGQRFIQTAWWMITFPGLAIIMVVLAFSMMGEGLTEIFNPKLRER